MTNVHSVVFCVIFKCLTCVFVVGEVQPPKEPETGEAADSEEKDNVEDSTNPQEGKATDVEKEKESALAGLPMGLGMAASDFRRLQANAREFLCLSSPIRRTLFGNAASAPPSTPLNHSTPQGPPPLERSQSGLSTDGEFKLF